MQISDIYVSFVREMQFTILCAFCYVFSLLLFITFGLLGFYLFYIAEDTLFGKRIN